MLGETFGLGGFATLRGFDQRAQNTDHAVLASLEISPKTYRRGCDESERSLRPYVFTDFGNGYLDEPMVGEDAYTLGLSTGLGFRYNVADRLSARVDWGYGIIDLGNTQRDNRVHFGLTWIPGPRPTR